MWSIVVDKCKLTSSSTPVDKRLPYSGYEGEKSSKLHIGFCTVLILINQS